MSVICSRNNDLIKVIIKFGKELVPKMTIRIKNVLKWILYSYFNVEILITK